MDTKHNGLKKHKIQLKIQKFNQFIRALHGLSY